MFQTRNDDGQTNQWATFAEAKLYAKHNPYCWKISFSVGSERIRLIRQDGFWVYQDINGNY